MEIQGHRGARGVMPENTLPAFQEAIEAGADVLELDLMVTRDGYLIINHDLFIHNDLVFSLSLTEIKSIDCGKTPNFLFPRQIAIPGTRIPTLSELFEFVKTLPHPHAKTVRFNLEMKRKSHHPEYTPPPLEYVRNVLEIVRKYGLEDRVAYSSFDTEILQEVRKQNPKALIGLAYEGDIEDMAKIGTMVGAKILSPDHLLIETGDQVKALQQKGFRVIPWTVNDTDRLEELLQMGVDGVMTDFPRDFIEFLKHH